MSKYYIHTKYYVQTKEADWLDTPAGTIWTTFIDSASGYYIQPLGERTSPLGVDLDILDDAEHYLFRHIQHTEIGAKIAMRYNERGMKVSAAKFLKWFYDLDWLGQAKEINDNVIFEEIKKTVS